MIPRSARGHAFRKPYPDLPHPHQVRGRHFQVMPLAAFETRIPFAPLHITVLAADGTPMLDGRPDLFQHACQTAGGCDPSTMGRIDIQWRPGEKRTWQPLPLRTPICTKLRLVQCPRDGALGSPQRPNGTTSLQRERPIARAHLIEILPQMLGSEFRAGVMRAKSPVNARTVASIAKSACR